MFGQVYSSFLFVQAKLRKPSFGFNEKTSDLDFSYTSTFFAANERKKQAQYFTTYIRRIILFTTFRNES